MMKRSPAEQLLAEILEEIKKAADFARYAREDAEASPELHPGDRIHLDVDGRVFTGTVTGVRQDDDETSAVELLRRCQKAETEAESLTYARDFQTKRAVKAEAEAESYRLNAEAAMDAAEKAEAEVKRLTEDLESHRSAVSRLVGERMERVDADGNALVTVRADDLRHMLDKANARVSTVVGDRLCRLLEEREADDEFKVRVMNGGAVYVSGRADRDGWHNAEWKHTGEPVRVRWNGERWETDE